MILYVNCCPREGSRTDRLARALLGYLGEYEELDLYAEELSPLDRESLTERDALLRSGSFGHPRFRYARQLAQAEEVVIAAPFWDLSFPAKLKLWIENIFAVGIVTGYDEHGIPYGLCRARKLWYVTTAGGPFDGRFGYEQLAELCRRYFGIPQTELVMAEMLDVAGNDPEKLMRSALQTLGERMKGDRASGI